MSTSLWITWEKQRRNRSMARELSIPIHEIISNQSRLIRYASLLLSTTKLLINDKPTVLFVQNPSVVLATFSVITKFFFNIRSVVVDAHNGGIFPLDGRSKILNLISLLIIKRADLTIVTNENLKTYVENRGGRAVVIPDPLPEFGQNVDELYLTDNFKSKTIITYVCTWASDEPFLEVIKAAAMLPENVYIYITGRPPQTLNYQIPENVMLTGYIDDKEYVKLLSSSALLMVLTSRDNCLNCGAYEAVSLCKPMILAKTAVIQSYFNKGAIYTGLSSEEIYTAINEAVGDLLNLSLEVVALKKDLINLWDGYSAPLRDFLDDIKTVS